MAELVSNDTPRGVGGGSVCVCVWGRGWLSRCGGEGGQQQQRTLFLLPAQQESYHFLSWFTYFY